jgi:hypothetical protein
VGEARGDERRDALLGEERLLAGEDDDGRDRSTMDR